MNIGITQADILNLESDNAAIKLALAETHVIQETKSYLESQGVVIFFGPILRYS